MIFGRLKKRVISVAALIIYIILFSYTNVFAADFPDVLAEHKNYDAINALVEKGVIAGYEDGYFRPEREITRTEFCALMARTLGYSKESYTAIELPFSDVPEDYWGIDFIAYCYELKLINGMGNNEFWPKDKVTLAQAAKMAVCAIGKQDEALEKIGDKWYDGYITVAEKFGILNFVDGQLDNAAIRGDIAQLVYNMTETGLTDIEPDKDDENLDFENEGLDEEPGENEEEKEHIPPEILAAYKNKDFSEVRTILIDAGHNYRGKDTGAENVELGLKEEEITWHIADKLRDNLEDMGYEVIMTREKITDSIGNTSVLDSLQARVDLAHEALADLFISIHCNAGGGSGTEVYCFQKGGYAGRLAELVQSEITENTTLYDRKTKTANFFVIQNTLMPAILIETGFIDSEKDVEVIASAQGQTKIAKAIATAVVKYDNMPKIERAVEETEKTEKVQEAEETEKVQEVQGEENDEETGTVGAGGQSE